MFVESTSMGGAARRQQLAQEVLPLEPQPAGRGAADKDTSGKVITKKPPGETFTAIVGTAGPSHESGRGADGPRRLKRRG
jgi:hypothetical protein